MRRAFALGCAALVLAACGVSSAQPRRAQADARPAGKVAAAKAQKDSFCLITPKSQGWMQSIGLAQKTKPNPHAKGDTTCAQ
jgi:hypothetical protein